MANKTHPQPTHPAILLSYCILLKMENLKFGVNFILNKSFFAEAVKHEELFKRERVQEAGVPLD